MLVVTRRINETIHLPEVGVVITICNNSRPGRMKIGIEAPPNVSIVRGEKMNESISGGGGLRRNFGTGVRS